MANREFPPAVTNPKARNIQELEVHFAGERAAKARISGLPEIHQLSVHGALFCYPTPRDAMTVAVPTRKTATEESVWRPCSNRNNSQQNNARTTSSSVIR